VIAWSWTDVSAPGRPFDERPSERHTGVVDGTGTPRPALDVLGDLAAQARSFWAHAERRPAPVALYVPERARTPERTYLQASTPDGLALFHADVLAARAHLPTELTRTPGPRHRFIVSPSAGRLTERDIATLHRAVHDGATLLVTLGDPLHGFPGTELTGVELVDFTSARRHGELIFDGTNGSNGSNGPSRSTPDGTTHPLRWEAGARAAVVAAPGAHMVARFPDGSPALTRRPLGRGEVWLLAAPVEAQLDDPEAFDLAAGAVPWHRLYRRIAESAGATAGLPWCDEPDVDLHPLQVDGADVVVAVNHTAAPVRTRIEGDAWPAGELLELGPKSAHTFFEGKVLDDGAFPSKKPTEEVAR
jgi:hypothetical protein